MDGITPNPDVLLVICILLSLINIVLYFRMRWLVDKERERSIVILSQMQQLMKWIDGEHENVKSTIQTMQSASANAYKLYDHTMKVLKRSGWTALKLNALAKAVEEVESGKDTQLILMKDLDPKVDALQVPLEKLESVGQEQKRKTAEQKKRIQKIIEEKAKKKSKWPSRIAILGTILFYSGLLALAIYIVNIFVE